MTISPEDPLIYHGGHADELFREERERGDTLTEDETLFSPGGYDDRQSDQPAGDGITQRQQAGNEDAGETSDQPVDVSPERA